MLEILNNGSVFHLTTGRISYLIHLEGNTARNIYFGKAIDGADALLLLAENSHSSFEAELRAERDEYPTWNGHSFHLPCVKVNGSHDRALFCEFTGYRTSESFEHTDENRDHDLLTLEFIDRSVGLKVELYYQLYHEYDIVARYAVLTSAHDKEITLDRVMSASVSVPYMRNYKARYTSGKWSGEFHIEECPVRTGVFRIESRRGITSHQLNPAIALSYTDAGEEHGNVWYGALAYSGNWSIEVEKTAFGNTHIVAGINSFDFETTLPPNMSFTTPVFYIGFSDAGYGKMSRTLHRFTREKVMPSGDKLRPVLYNSWEATSFDVCVDGQKRLADIAEKLGCELFVLDDGWFGARNSDSAGLGDWHVNQNKFPNGLFELSDYVKRLGMRFGIWVEPESVNPDSELYRNHPDWVYRYPDRTPITLRNEYLLNINLPEVQEYLMKALTDLLADKNITFIKWDMNRVITEPANKAIWHGHVEAVYKIYKYIKLKFPDVEIETCSGGGARIDLGILRYADQCWTSDNTDPYNRLFIQDGYTQFYPTNAMMCWVTDSPTGSPTDLPSVEHVGEHNGNGAKLTNRCKLGWVNRPLPYRFHSAMCGGLGIGADISKYTDDELSESAFWIARYKEWRHIIQFGELYRLLSPLEGHITAVEYVSRTDGETTFAREAVVFVFASGLTPDEKIPPLLLCGLDKSTRYRLTSYSSSADTPDIAYITGCTLMNAGFTVHITGDFSSRAIYIQKL